MRVARWNFERDNLGFDMELEVNMLAEEAQEFKDGMVDYFNAVGVEQLEDAIVELVDAWADFRFVLQGTKFKSLGLMADFGSADQTENYMYTCLTEEFYFLSPEILELAFDAVVTANEEKGIAKVNGKIQKGSEWIDPKAAIRDLVSQSARV